MENDDEVELTPFTTALEKFKASITYKMVLANLGRYHIPVPDAESLLRLIFEGGYNYSTKPPDIKRRNQKK